MVKVPGAAVTTFVEPSELAAGVNVHSEGLRELATLLSEARTRAGQAPRSRSSRWWRQWRRRTRRMAGRRSHHPGRPRARGHAGERLAVTVAVVDVLLASGVGGWRWSAVLEVVADRGGGGAGDQLGALNGLDLDLQLRPARVVPGAAGRSQSIRLGPIASRSGRDRRDRYRTVPAT